jgi:hypothetical protein
MTCASIAERYRNVADPALERDARDVAPIVKEM